MKLVRFLAAAVCVASCGSAVSAADEPPAKSKMREVLNARAAEQAKKPTAPAASKSIREKNGANPMLSSANAPAPTVPASGTAPTPTITPATAATSTTKSESAVPVPSAESPTVLPKVEVRRDRVTELDQQIALQEQEMAREKKNLEQTEVDKALNDSKVAKALSIFGGQSSRQRAGVAAERVNLMQEERDLLEVMRYAKTKEEKAGLQKQLDELRALRRELEKTLR